MITQNTVMTTVVVTAMHVMNTGTTQWIRMFQQQLAEETEEVEVMEVMVELLEP